MGHPRGVGQSRPYGVEEGEQRPVERRPAGPPEAVVFDLDGVLVDSLQAVTASVNLALAEHGLPARPARQLRRLIGPPTVAAFAELTGWPPDSPALAALIDTYHEHYGAVFLEQTSLVDDVIPVLGTLARRLPLAVATSKAEDFTEPLLERLGLRVYFATVAAADARASDEDKTALVGRALAALGHTRAAMVGDRSFDMEAARAHGLLAIGVTWGIGSIGELSGAGADALAGSPHELVPLLLPS